MNVKLTKPIIDKATYEGRVGRRYVLWDSEIPGFGLRVYPSGKKSFILSFRSGGQKQLLTLGQYGVLSLQQARDMAKKNLGDVVQGKNPLQQRKEIKQGESMKDLCSDYLETHSKQHKKSWEKDQTLINLHILPFFKSIRVGNIKNSDIATLHSRIGKEFPYQANRVLSLLHTLFEHALKSGILPDMARNPAQGIERYREQKRDRFVTSDEMPKLLDSIEKESNLYARTAILLYLLTGLRKTELLRVKWADIDWSRKEVKISDTKTGKPLYLPLSEQAIGILQNTPKLLANPYVLPGHKIGHHLVNINKPWGRIRKEAEIEDVRLHDLRRTVGSWLAESGASLALIGKVLNHTCPSTTSIYARFSQDPVRNALNEHGAKLLKRKVNK